MSMEELIIAILLAVISLYFIVINVLAFYENNIRKKSGKFYSPSPFIGGVFGALALLLFFGIKHLWLLIIPFILDGTIPVILMLIYSIFTNFKGAAKSRANKKEEDREGH